jgi:hypothetical protein
MFASFKRARIQKKLDKCKIELGGVQAELATIDKLCKLAQSINYGQANRLQVLGRRVGELQTEIAIHEHTLNRIDWANSTQAGDD